MQFQLCVIEEVYTKASIKRQLEKKNRERGNYKVEYLEKRFTSSPFSFSFSTLLRIFTSGHLVLLFFYH